MTEAADNPQQARDADPRRPETDEAVSFGFEKVSPKEKTSRVGGVFSAVADRYDLMNDLMSLGSHRLFKRMMLQMAGVREGHYVLDLAGGTGDMAALFAPTVGAQGRVVLTDLNRSMMQVGRDRLLDQGISQVEFCQAPAEQLPFAENSFDCVCISFGIRNFTDKDQSLAEILRVLKPGAALLVLEFSTPTNPLLETAYHLSDTLAARRQVIGWRRSTLSISGGIYSHAPEPEIPKANVRGFGVR